MKDSVYCTGTFDDINIFEERLNETLNELGGELIDIKYAHLCKEHNQTNFSAMIIYKPS